MLQDSGAFVIIILLAYVIRKIGILKEVTGKKLEGDVNI